MRCEKCMANMVMTKTVDGVAWSCPCCGELVDACSDCNDPLDENEHVRCRSCVEEDDASH